MQELQEKINSVLSDPESLAQVMSMVSTLAPMMQNTDNPKCSENVKQNSDNNKQDEAINVTKAQPMSLTPEPEALPVSKMSAPVKLPKDRRCALLEALKPYLKRSRAERVDQLIRILQISDILGIDTRRLFR